MKIHFAIALALALVACGPEPDDEAAVVIAPNFASIQANLFDRSCISCHGAGRQGDLDLRAAASYAGLVSVNAALPAAAALGLKRVLPGDAEKSFLYMKLAGPSSDLGRRMPVRGDPLTPDQLAAVRDWINNGAAK